MARKNRGGRKGPVEQFVLFVYTVIGAQGYIDEKGNFVRYRWPRDVKSSMSTLWRPGETLDELNASIVQELREKHGVHPNWISLRHVMYDNIITTPRREKFVRFLILVGNDEVDNVESSHSEVWKRGETLRDVYLRADARLDEKYREHGMSAGIVSFEVYNNRHA